jgi:hypothetical protein
LGQRGSRFLGLDRRQHFLDRLLYVPTAVWGPGIDHCAVNIVSPILLKIVSTRTNAAGDNRHFCNINNVAGLAVFTGLMRRSRKGQCWHFTSLASATLSRLGSVSRSELNLSSKLQSSTRFALGYAKTSVVRMRTSWRAWRRPLAGASGDEEAVGPWLRRASFTPPPTTGSKPCAIVFTSLHESSISTMSRPRSKGN